jgi:hypothetical protein
VAGYCAEGKIVCDDGCVLGGELLALEDDGVGSIDSRSISPRRRSRSLSAWPPALFARSCSIWFRSCAPSDLRLLTNVSTFFSRLFTVSFISLYHFFAAPSPASKSRNSW